jgi:A/G-specific adenine glycosylase
LAAADTRDVLELLRPLGFVHRNERLPALARALVSKHGGAVPESEAELLALPGVGRYVANAVLVLAFGERRPLLDPSVIRLLDRCLGLRSARSRPREDPRLWSVLEYIVSGRNPRAAALGMIDLGAVVCLPRRPRCGTCPLKGRCLAFQRGTVEPELGRRAH